jgi:hypothetical protein
LKLDHFLHKKVDEAFTDIHAEGHFIVVGLTLKFVVVDSVITGEIGDNLGSFGKVFLISAFSGGFTFIGLHILFLVGIHK